MFSDDPKHIGAGKGTSCFRTVLCPPNLISNRAQDVQMGSESQRRSLVNWELFSHFEFSCL